MLIKKFYSEPLFNLILKCSTQRIIVFHAIRLLNAKKQIRFFAISIKMRSLLMAHIVNSGKFFNFVKYAGGNKTPRYDFHSALMHIPICIVICILNAFISQEAN